MFTRRDESDTYLTHVSRHPCRGDSTEKRWNMRAFSQHFGQSTSIADESHSVSWKFSYFISSPHYHCYKDVYRHESGRCHSFPFLLTFSTMFFFSLFVPFNPRALNFFSNSFPFLFLFLCCTNTSFTFKMMSKYLIHSNWKLHKSITK